MTLICATEGCHRQATGEAYSAGVKLGAYCDAHGSGLLDSGQADASEQLEVE